MRKSRLLASLMAIIMLFSLIPVSAMAEGESDAVIELTVNGTTTQYPASKLQTEDGFFPALQVAAGEIEVKLLANIENIPGYIPVQEGQTVTLDLNGHALSTGLQEAGRHYYAIHNYGTFTLQDRVGGGTITARGIQNLGGEMIIESGKIISCDENGGACIWNEGKLTVNGGVFETTHVGASSDEFGVGCLSNQASGNVLITGGTFHDVNKRTYAIISVGEMEITPAPGKEVIVEGAHGALSSDGGTLVVNGGSYSSTDYYGLYVSNDGTGKDPTQAAVTVNDGTFSGKKYAVWIGSDINNPVNSTIEINGGTFEKPLKAQENTRDGAIVVYGGSFYEGLDSEYLAGSVQAVTDEETGVVEVVPLTEEDAVAQVGSTYYKTLESAIDAARDGQTVTLLGNTTENITIPADRNIIFDLNGQTLTGLVSAAGTLVVADRSIDAEPAVDGANDYTVTYTSGKIENTEWAVAVQDGGMFTLESGTVSSTNGCAISAGTGTVNIEGGYIHAQEFSIHAGKGTVNVSGGVMESADNAVISGNGTSGENGYTINMEGGTLIGRISSGGYASCGIYHPNGGTVNVSGGKIISTKGAGIVARAGTTNVTGGEIIALGDSTFVGKVGDSGVTVPTSGIVLDLAAGYPGTNSADIKVNVSGEADVSGTKDALSVVETFGDKTVKENNNVNISGGSFSSKVNENYCAPGFVPTTVVDENGKYTVTPDTGSNEAMITKADGTKIVCTTLAGAISAAEEGDTITLLKDVEITSKINSLPAGVTLDGANKELKLTEDIISQSGGVFDITNNNVTIQNLTIDAGTNAKYGVQFYKSEGGKLDGVTINGGTFAAVNVNGADVTINNSTLAPAVDSGAYANIDYSMGTGVTTVPKLNVTGTITYNTAKPLIHADQAAMAGVINKTSGEALTLEEKSEALTEISKKVTVEGQKLVLTEDGTVVSKSDYKASTLTTDIASKTFVAGSTDWVEFTFSTVANDDAGVWVIGGSDFGVAYEDKIAALEYEAGDTWVNMKGQNFGGSGFPMTDATSTFRVKFAAGAAGTYTFNASMKNAHDQTVVCETSVTFTVSDKSTPVTPSNPGTSSRDDDDGYSVSVPSSSSIKNGSITVSPRSAEKGDTVTITVKPDAGYELDTLTVTDSSGKTVKLTEKRDNQYTFTMPASAVRVQVSFTRSGSAAERRFTDVSDSYWAESEIAWAAENGYMNGNTATTFNPEGTVTRQQLWMILARLSGYAPADFAEAKAWAVDNAISDGTNPGGAVSRQQLVTILYRYAVRMGYKTTGAADLTAYPDHGSVAAYAGDAMSWSVANSIVGGTAQGTLNPAGTATRAQFAVILYRFCDKVVG